MSALHQPASSPLSSGIRRLAFGLVLAVALATACGSPTKPSNTPPPPPTPDPPSITCPEPVTVVSPTATNVAYGNPTTANGKSPVTTACTPESGTSFSPGKTTVTCTATDALQRTATCTFLVTVQAPPKLKVTRFVAFGDSITWGEDGSLSLTVSGTFPRIHPRNQYPLTVTYPGALQLELASRYQTQSPSVMNGGLPGERLTEPGTLGPDPNTLGRLSSLIALNAYDVVLIMEGSNDLADRDDHVFPGAIEALRQMILDAKSRNVRAYLATVPPMDPNDPCCRNRGAALVAPFNEQVRSLAASQGVTLVDVYAALSPDVNTYIGPDGVHPTVQGYAKIADTFAAAIEKTLEQAASTAGTPAGLFPAAAGLPWNPAPALPGVPPGVRYR